MDEMVLLHLLSTAFNHIGNITSFNIWKRKYLSIVNDMDVTEYNRLDLSVRLFLNMNL